MDFLRTPIQTIQWVQRLLDAPCESLARWLNKSEIRKESFYLLVSIIAGCIAYQLSQDRTPFMKLFSGKGGFGYRFLQYLPLVVTLCFSFGWIFFKTDQRPKFHRWRYLAIILLGYFGWIYARNLMYGMYERAFGNLVALLIALFPLGLLCFSYFRERLKVWHLIVISIGSGTLISYLMTRGILIPNGWPLTPHRILLITIFFVIERPLLKEDKIDWTLVKAYFFSPSHLVTTLPVKVQSLARADNLLEIRIKGLRDVVFGFLLIIFWFKSSLWLNMRSEVLSHSILQYLRFYCISNASIGIPVGMMRWMGWQLPNHYNVPLLAWSPAERWRRWNTYFFNWFASVIFIPLHRKTGKPFLGLMAVFVMTAYIHSGVDIYYFLATGKAIYLRLFERQLIFFTFHGLAVYISIRFPFIFGSTYSPRAWLGVLITWIMMCSIHFFAPI
ncbi:MAG: hypothetical protein AB7O96_17490 [Pseudobdellovibrionaceae bacterium]